MFADYRWYIYFCIWVFRSVKIILLILSRVNRKVGRKRDIHKKSHLITCKQNLACLTCDPSRTHRAEMTSDLERQRLAALTTQPRGAAGVVYMKDTKFFVHFYNRKLVAKCGTTSLKISWQKISYVQNIFEDSNASRYLLGCWEI